MGLLLLILIFCGFAIIGLIVFNNGRERKVFYQSLVQFCSHLNVEITFSKMQLSQVIAQYQNSYPSRHFGRMLGNFKELLDKKSDISREAVSEIMWQKLRTDEQLQISEFLVNLGRHGIKEEVEKLSSAMDFFSTRHKDATAKFKRESVLALKLFIIVGLACVILLV